MPADIPPAFRAAEIALVAIKQNRCTSWDDLVARGVDPRLEPDQLNLVESELDVVRELRVVTSKPVTVVYCPECGRLGFHGTGTVPAKCRLTFECTGKPVKASATPKKILGPTEPEPETSAPANTEPAEPVGDPTTLAAGEVPLVENLLHNFLAEKPDDEF